MYRSHRATVSAGIAGEGVEMSYENLLMYLMIALGVITGIFLAAVYACMGAFRLKHAIKTSLTALLAITVLIYNTLHPNFNMVGYAFFSGALAWVVAIFVLKYLVRQLNKLRRDNQVISS